jgi:hypothetical protein
VTYKDLILGDGAFAYWPLDDAVGTVAKDIASGFNLTVENSANAFLGSTDFLPNAPGTSLRSNEFTATAATSASILAALDDADGQTFEVWTEILGVGSGGDIVLSATGNTAGHLDRWNGDTTAYPCYFETARHNNFGGSFPISGILHLVYTRRTGGSFRQIRNGVVTGDEAAFTYGPNSVYWLGGNGSGLSSNGRYKHNAIYKHELTPAQVKRHFEAGMYGISGGSPRSVSVGSSSPV